MAKDCSYADMTKGKVMEDSESPYYDAPYINQYEMSRKGNFNQSGTSENNVSNKE